MKGASLKHAGRITISAIRLSLQISPVPLGASLRLSLAMAHLRNKLRSGDVWVERPTAYRQFDSYMLPQAESDTITAGLGLPSTAEAWLEGRGRELDWRLKRFAHRLQRGRLEGVEMRDDRLHITPVKLTTPPEAGALADRLDAMLPRIAERIYCASGGASM